MLWLHGVLFLLGGKCKLSNFEKGVGKKGQSDYCVGCGGDRGVEEGDAVVEVKSWKSEVRKKF